MTRPVFTGLAARMAGALLAGTLAIGGIVLAYEGNPKYSVVAFGTMALLIALPLITNFRLFCLYAIIMLAPLSLRASFMLHPHMGGAAALYIEAVDPFLLALLAVQLRARFRGRRDTYHFPRALGFFAALMALGMVTSLFFPLRTLALLELARMAKCLVLALVIANELVTRRHFQHALYAVLGGVFIEAVIALAQNLMGAQLGLEFLGEAKDADVKLLGQTSLESGEFVYRAGGLIGHANLFAAYLSLFLPVAAALMLTTSSRVLKALSMACLLLGAPALVLTLSRGGWLDFLAAVTVVLALGIAHPVSRKQFLFSRVAVVCGIIVVGVALSPMIYKRLTEADPTSVEWRLKWIRTAQAMVLDNPVFGVGLNAYVFAQVPYGQFKTPGEMSQFYGDYWPVVHNNWLIVWSEQGTTGMLMWVLFHLSMLAACVRNLRIRDPVMHAVALGLFGGFVAIMVDGMASFFVRYESTARMFWIAVGMILAADIWRRLNEDERPVVAEPEAPPRARALATAPARAHSPWLPSRPSPLR